MAWLRVGDNVNTHPLMSRLVEACEYDHSLKLEAFGLFIAMATSSAAHLTDYVVEPGLVGVLAPGKEKALMDVLRAATLVENIKDEEDGRWLYQLTNDVDFVHMRSRAEVEIDRDRSRDRRNPELAIPVRVRDGDQCRWCGRTVKFADHKSARGGTIDSLNGHQESTIDTLVVACRGCNSERKDGKPGFTLMPAPEVPYYSKSTLEFVNTHPWAKANGVHIEPAQPELDLDAAARAAAAPGEQAAAQEHEEAPSVAAGPTPAAAPRSQAAATTDSAARTAAAQKHVEAPSVAAGPTPAAAPHTSTPQPADPRDQDDEPAWLTTPISELTSAAARAAAAPGEQAAAQEHEEAPSVAAGPAPAAAPRSQAAAAADSAAQTEDNETVKPDRISVGYPERITGGQGDDPELSGSGRVGSGRAGTGLGRFGQAVREKSVRRGRKRGSRGGKKR